MKMRRDVIDMTGWRVGQLVVLQFAGRHYFPGGQTHALWRVFCRSCKQVRTMMGKDIRRHVKAGREASCGPCGVQRMKDKCVERAVRIPSGDTVKTITQIAEESGVPRDTVEKRYHRGWPAERLGEPVKIIRPRKREAK